MLNFNDDGLMPPGLHEYAFNDFKSQFIDQFGFSQSRKAILEGCLKWLFLISNIITPEEVWMDGSYVTAKANPNDIDIVLFFDSEKLNAVDKGMFYNLFSISKQYLCDSYFAVSIIPGKHTANDINIRNYWRGQFGFDRNDKPKGIIILTWQEFIKGLKEVSII